MSCKICILQDIWYLDSVDILWWDLEEIVKKGGYLWHSWMKQNTAGRMDAAQFHIGYDMGDCFRFFRPYSERNNLFGILAVDGDASTHWETEDHITDTTYTWVFAKPLKITKITLVNKALKSSYFASCSISFNIFTTWLLLLFPLVRETHSSENHIAFWKCLMQNTSEAIRYAHSRWPEVTSFLENVGRSCTNTE